MKKNILRVILLGFGILCLAVTSVLASGMVAKSAQANEMAPDFTLKGVNGQTVSLKDFRGKGVIMFFFTTWCPHCQDKFPMLVSNYDTYKKEGIELVIIDAGESEAKVRSYVQKQNAPFDVFIDTDLAASKAYGVLGVPSFFLINKDGKIVFDGHEMPGNYKDLLKS